MKTENRAFLLFTKKRVHHKCRPLPRSSFHFIALLLVSTVVILYGANIMRLCLQMATPLYIVREKSYTVPCFKGDVAVEQPVVLRTTGVLTAGQTLRGNRAVCGCRTWVAPWCVVASVQGVNGGCMVLMTGRVGVREWQRRRPQPRVVLKGSVWKRRKNKLKHIISNLKE